MRKFLRLCVVFLEANKRDSDGTWLIPYDELKKLPRWRRRRADVDVLSADDSTRTAVDGSSRLRD